VGKTIRKALTRRERYLFPTEQAALAAIDAALAEPQPITCGMPSFADPEPSGYAYRYSDGVLRISSTPLTINGAPPIEVLPYWFAPPAAALAEQDAIARAVEAAVKECVTICEQQRVKILKNPADPSWTEHLAEVQSEMKQRFGVEMGYPALAEQEQKQKPATGEQMFAAYNAQASDPQKSTIAFYCDGWRDAERFHGIRKEDGK
jgi:hypothetical protein